MGDVTRVAITGASGFIGRATVAAAVKAGLEVVAVQRSAVALGVGSRPWRLIWATMRRFRRWLTRWIASMP